MQSVGRQQRMAPRKRKVADVKEETSLLRTGEFLNGVRYVPISQRNLPH